MTRHHHDFACETTHARTLARYAPHTVKYISPKKTGHFPKKPSAIPGGSPGAIPGAIPVGLALGLPPGPAMGLPLGAAQGIADDALSIGGQP